ncbi:MAG: ABC transporter substrate-binding protein, partial [Thermomicrobiales bacterium]
QDAKQTGGQIVVARAGDSDSLDPAHTTAGIAFQVFNNIYDTLIAYDKDLGYEGILAESWDISDDGLEYTFHLRSGIAFHDGTEFNADAVKFTFDRLIDPKTNAPAGGWIDALKETRVDDPQTVTMVLKTPFSPLLGNLCLSYFGITSPTAVQKFGDSDYGRNPVGTGPWKFKEWVAGEQIVLEANDAYQNHHSLVTNTGRPYADELIFRNITEDATQIAAFETGEVTIIPLPPREVERFQSDDQYQVVIPERSTNIWFIEWSIDPPADAATPVAGGTPVAGSKPSFKAPFFDDIRVRQAVAYAINPDEIISGVFQGLATRNYGPIPTGHFSYNPDIEQYGFHFDQEKAKALLDEAGWVLNGDVREKDGKKLEPLLWTWNAGNNVSTVQVLQNQLAAVGFAVKVETMEIATLLARQPENVSDFDVMSWGWPEPHLMKMMVDGEGGLSSYHDPDYLALVDEAARVTDQESRSALYFQAAQKMLADVAMVPLWSTLTGTGVRGELKDYKQGPTGTAIYEDANFS